MFSRHDPDKLYAFSNHVHLTTNEGQSWEVISPDLTTDDKSKQKSSGGPITQDNTSVEYYCTIFAVNESPLKEGLLWVGSDDGLIHVTRDGGKNWENVTPKGMPKWMMINSIEPSYFDEGTCYVAGTMYKSGDYAPYLYKTTDYGKTWKKITDGIPAEHFTRVVREDPQQQGLLYAGTENGMYISFNDGGSWKPFQLNLPLVPITDLYLRDNNLIVATQGRSIYIIDDLTVLHQLYTMPEDTKTFLFKPMDTYRMSGGGRSGSLTSGANHPGGVMTYFYLDDFDEKKDTVHLTYYDAKGDTIKTYSTVDGKNSLKAKKGLNEFNWDMTYDGAERLPGMILWWASTDGPMQIPGNYKVSLDVNGNTITKPYTVVADPRSEETPEGWQAQFDFINEVNATVDKAHKSIKKIRGVEEKLTEFESRYKDDKRTKDLREKAKNLREKFADIEKALYQTQNRSGQDPLNFPIRLTNKLAHLNSLVGMGDFGPTDQDIAVKDELTAQINKELDAFNALVDAEVSEFNRQFNALELDYLSVETDKEK